MSLSPSRLSGLILLVVTTLLSASAQDPEPPMGMRPYDTFQAGDIDTISVTTGRLAVNIPLISYPQRGGKLKMDFVLHYENDGGYANYQCILSVCHYIWYPRPEGFAFADRGDLGLSSQQFTDPASHLPYTINSVIDPDGGSHLMMNVGTSSQESVDATGYQIANSAIVDQDGTRFTFTNSSCMGYASIVCGSSLREDSNGNEITYSSSTGWIDTIGRQIPMPVSTTDFTGCTGPLPTYSAETWSLPGPSNGAYLVKICRAEVNTVFGYQNGSSLGPFSLNVPAMQSVLLPNGTSWVMAYDSTGRLSSVTFPTGGSVSYSWSATTDPCGPPVVPNLVYDPYVTGRSMNAADGSPIANWAYSYQCNTPATGQSTTAITDPLGNQSVHVSELLGTTGLFETQAQFYQGTTTNGTLLKTVSTAYSYYTGAKTYPNGPSAINIVPISTTTSWPSGQVSEVTHQYDSGFTFTNPDPPGTTQYQGIYGKELQRINYDYGSGAPGGVLHRSVTQYLAFANSAYLALNMLKPVSSVTTYDSSSNQCNGVANTYCAFTSYGYDGTSLQSSGISTQHDPSPPAGSNRGNQTSVNRFLNTGTLTCPSGASAGSNFTITANRFYFDTGMLQSNSDPCKNSTSYLYSGTFAGAYATTITNALGQAFTYNYDFNTGLLTSKTDPNLLSTTYSYDEMLRLSQTTDPDQGTDTITYQETAFPFTATETKTINSAESAVSVHVFDGFGRVTETQLTSDPQGTVYADTAYDGLGHIGSISNPYRKAVGGNSDPTSSPGTTTYAYDGLGRKTVVNYPDGSVLQTAYCGPNTLVTDPTKKWRRSRVDGLERLVEVDEPNSATATVASTGCPGKSDPDWVTSYAYDTLGNVKSAVQNSSRNRAFTYDSISRLLTSANPETGTVAYTYNPDGTVLTKTDARSVTTCFGTWSSGTSSCGASTGYDALHRLLQTTYSNGDPTLTFAYDQASCINLSKCQNIGHRTSMTDGAGSEKWTYYIDTNGNDPLPRDIHQEQRTTNGVTKTATYDLDLRGNLTKIVYPTGRTVNYTYDSADRASTAVDSSNGITYAADWKTPPANANCTAGAVCYTPQGSIYSMSLGQTSSFAGVNILESFSSRLQPSEIKASSSDGSAFDITYNFVDPVTTGNAGHVYGITNNLNSSRSQAFTYDQLNRIASAGTTATTGTYCWGYQYTYDTWGNLLSQVGWAPTYNACTQTNMTAVTANSNNQISGFTYDASGNTQNDGTYSYTWDGESQLKTAGGVTYSYDGDGRRVAKVGSKLYWYGLDGEILAETDASGNKQNEYIFFGGKRLAVVPASGSVLYYAEDTLGTSRVMLESNGAVCYDADFTPFGDERPYVSSCAQNYKFEGKERDSETLNDDFGARYYSWRFGRWLSSDWSAVPVAVPYANLTNPQTLNLYAMASDDLESSADLDGHLSGANPFEFGTVTGCGEGGFNGCAYEMAVEVYQQEQEAKPVPQPQPAAQNQVTPQSLAAQVPADAKAAIMNSLNASNAPTADDKKGGFHEESVKWGTDASGNVVVSPSVPGAYAPPGTNPNTNFTPANPATDQKLATVDGFAHIHPKGGGDRSFVQGPSAADLKFAGQSSAINLVVGAANKKVYFFNGSGVIGKPMKLKDFMGD